MATTEPHTESGLLDGRSALPALALAGSSRAIRRLGWNLGLLFLVALVALLFLPWQQFIRGAGKVVALDPLERLVNVESPLGGRVLKSYVVEGQSVDAGDLLFEITDNDPQLMANLQAQRLEAVARRDAATQRLASIESQLAQIVRSVRLGIEAAQTRLDAAEYAARTAALQYERIRALHEDARGLASRRELELATLDRDRTAAELVRARADRERADTDGQASLNSLEASRESARSDLASARQALTSYDIQINRTEMLQVTAPRAGTVFRVQATDGMFLSSGSPLCTIIPETDSRMVELWVDGNDMPLIQAREVDEEGRVIRPGSPARLQFEGWPAIQFVGWPSVAIGTFGGEVLLVDPTDDGRGRFRVLVAPAPDVVERRGQTTEIRWPGNRWLRQGVRANGWVLLQRVPLWYEVWRQLNGFPPVVADAEPVRGKVQSGGKSDGK